MGIHNVVATSLFASSAVRRDDSSLDPVATAPQDGVAVVAKAKEAARKLDSVVNGGTSARASLDPKKMAAESRLKEVLRTSYRKQYPDLLEQAGLLTVREEEAMQTAPAQTSTIRPSHMKPKE